MIDAESSTIEGGSGKVRQLPTDIEAGQEGKLIACKNHNSSSGSSGVASWFWNERRIVAMWDNPPTGSNKLALGLIEKEKHDPNWFNEMLRETWTNFHSYALRSIVGSTAYAYVKIDDDKVIVKGHMSDGAHPRIDVWVEHK